MKKILDTLSAQFRTFYLALPPVKRNVLLVSIAIGILGIGLVVSMLTQKDHVVLFTNVSTDNMPTVMSHLKKRNVPFSIGADGTSVYVPRDLLPATQMAIMEEMGSDKSGTLGLELFEKQEFGVTSYQQRVQYQRAIQGELMRAINTLSAVKQSKVLLAMPAKKTFLEEGGQATASVIVELQPGKILSPDQVRGITHLVSSAVEGLDVSRVTVVDERGKVMSKNSNSETSLSNDLLELKKRRETEFEERIESILSKVVGAGKVIARVDATLTNQSVDSLVENVDADGSAIRSQVTEEEMLDGSRTNPAGVPGARANLPGAQDQGQVGFQQNVRKEIKNTNYAVPKTTKKMQEAAGALTRISVAVLVDGTTQFVDENGQQVEKWTERTPAELAKYETIVKSAIGFVDKRGDSVKIENIRFEKEPFDEANKILTSLELKRLIHSLFKWSLLGLSLALIFFVVVRPFMRWITDSFQDTVEDMLPRTIEELEDLQAGDSTLPGMSGALPVLEESLDPTKAESELLKERIMAIMTDDIEKTSSAFNMWVARRDS
jgi:flagellar M-ring protein FliF